MNTKNKARLRRARKSRVKLRTAGSVRLSVHRTPKHIYAQVISGDSKTVLAQASTLDKDLRASATGNVTAAAAVGKLVAERAKSAGVTSVAFDRSGFRYHGRVKALAEAAREGGLEF
ncbi:MAG: 50S ribosomal protein L18 [Luminiphilus sp.]|jgi:large subunit ribosomal protein L18|nr:50S ribosomal protein L18 [Halieaceae bacterium]MBL6699695.1 50S ribosomal protein L18 [Luminiphilus sp.]MAI93411.1 50S ribosomal protein L18 [Halieaceae bacterium]MBL6897357.1 50S ribosomal protein L18 [Luminiphilus sp.]MCH1580105.1 50S ribosomal protein L18 [Luminiphilus sp.]|tara:strand:- start:3071 stop:3421 length:351 start_codon:yes stop_codon:yes gene_type:complete